MEEVGGLTSASPKGYPLQSFDQAIRFLSNPKASGIRTSVEMQEHGRLLSLIFDSIQRLTDTNRSRIDTYFPSDREIYEDIQHHKRTISDRTPMPLHGEMMKVCVMMAELDPPLLYILREFAVVENRLRFVTKFVAATEHEAGNRVSSGLRQVIHNSIATIKTHLIGMDFNRPLQEKASLFSRIEDLPGIVRLGRVDQILSEIYLRKSDIEKPDEQDLFRLHKINQMIREMVFRQILVELTRAHLTVKVSLESFRKGTGRSLPDVVLFNNLNSTRFRSKIIADLLVTKPVITAIESILPHGFSVLAETDDREKISYLVAEKVLEAAGARMDLPDPLVELCAERMALDSYMKDLEKQDQIETDRQEMQKLLQTMKNHSGVLRVKHGNRITINERILDFLVRGLFPGILIGTEPPFSPGTKNHSARDYQTIYLLLKDREATARAIEQAEELHSKTQDVVLIRLLEQMTRFHDVNESELKEVVAPAYTGRLQTLIATSYLPALPFFSRMWLMIKGRLPGQREQTQLWNSYVQKAEKAAQKMRKKDRRGPMTEASGGPKQNELDERMHMILTRMAEIAASMWEKGQYPDRRLLMRAFNKQDDKDLAERLLGFVHAGAASTRELIEIALPNREVVYASRQHFEDNLTELRERYRRRMADFDGHQTRDGVRLSMKHRTEEKEAVAAVLKVLNNIGPQT